MGTAQQPVYRSTSVLSFDVKRMSAILTFGVQAHPLSPQEAWVCVN
jgi:hypothetical protein